MLTFKQLKELPIHTEVYLVSKGDVIPYYTIGSHPIVTVDLNVVLLGKYENNYCVITDGSIYDIYKVITLDLKEAYEHAMKQCINKYYEYSKLL